MKVDYKYYKGYIILMKYWDCIPEEEQKTVHEKLMEIGL